jgi:hypothetical protein
MFLLCVFIFITFEGIGATSNGPKDHVLVRQQMQVHGVLDHC